MANDPDPLPVVIRPFRPTDILPLCEAVRESEEHIRKWMTWCGKDYSSEQATAFIDASQVGWKESQLYNFAIVSAADETFLGSVGLNRLCRMHGCANVAYWVRRSWAGKGVATKAVALVAEFGLNELGFNRLEILVPDANQASKRVAEKAGAKREGLLRKRLILSGDCQDAVMYSLVASDVPDSGELKKKT